MIVRETEKVLDEKVTLRTEEVPCPITGIPHLRTVEVVEKVIETEVSKIKKIKIISTNLYIMSTTKTMVFFPQLFFAADSLYIFFRDWAVNAHIVPSMHNLSIPQTIPLFTIQKKTR